MQFAVVDDKQSPNAQLERVVRLRPGWVRHDYVNRSTELENMNLMDFIGSVKSAIILPNADPPLVNYRHYLDTVKFVDIMSGSNAVDPNTREERQEKPPTANPPTDDSWSTFNCKNVHNVEQKEGDAEALSTAVRNSRKHTGNQSTNSCASSESSDEFKRKSNLTVSACFVEK